MVQAKKKTATKTAKKTTRTTTRKSNNKNMRSPKQQGQGSNMFFVISMTILAATLLFADLLMMSV